MSAVAEQLALLPGEFRATCHKVHFTGTGTNRSAYECSYATADAAELAEHMASVHGIKDSHKVPKKLRPYPVPRPRKGEDLVFTPKAWAAGDMVEFETKSEGTRTGQVWSDAPATSSVWVVDAETGAAWCVKKPGEYALAYAIDMKWGGRL